MLHLFTIITQMYMTLTAYVPLWKITPTHLLVQWVIRLLQPLPLFFFGYIYCATELFVHHGHVHRSRMVAMANFVVRSTLNSKMAMVYEGIGGFKWWLPCSLFVKRYMVVLRSNTASSSIRISYLFTAVTMSVYLL